MMNEFLLLQITTTFPNQTNATEWCRTFVVLNGYFACFGEKYCTLTLERRHAVNWRKRQLTPKQLTQMAYI